MWIRMEVDLPVLQTTPQKPPKHFALEGKLLLVQTETSALGQRTAEGIFVGIAGQEDSVEPSFYILHGPDPFWAPSWILLLCKRCI